MIDLSSMQHEIDMNKREYYLSLHTNEIWKSKDGRWYTHLTDEKRTLKKRNSEKELQDVIVDYYKNLEEDPILKDWISEKLKSTEICKGTYDRYENDYKRFFNGIEIENKKVRNISDDELEQFIKDTIIKCNLTQKGYAGLRTLVIGIYKHAKKKKCTNISISYFMKDLEIPITLYIR